MSAVYQVGFSTVHSDDPKLPEMLAKIYIDKTRPLCMCRNPGIAMYVAKVEGRHLIKRMPNSGGEHSPTCESYEPPAELSGLGQVKGTAIQEDTDEGKTALRLGFSLSKSGGRAAPAPSGKESDSVKSDGNKLTLRGTLHYLFEEAGFNRWAPAMNGKRNWYVLRKYLLQAAEDKTAKGASLADALYIPESYSAGYADNITQRRRAKLGKIAAPERGARKLMLLVGEVMSFEKARYGFKVMLEHLPDYFFMLNEDLHTRMVKRFESELALQDAITGAHLLMIGTFSVAATGIATIEELALMTTTANWIPFEHTYDKALLDALTDDGRKFMKGMRYNLASSKPLACAVTLDTESPTAMYVIPPGADEQYRAEVDELVADSKMASWVWDAASTMPPLPVAATQGE